MALLAWLADTVVGRLFKELFGAMLEGIDRKRAADAQREAGRLEQKTTDQAATIAAQQRSDEAGAAPHDDAATRQRIGDGTI